MLFIAIEIIFVLIVFREFPSVNVYSTIWIAHIIYRSVVILCSLRREKAKTVYIRTMALWSPMVLHLLIHIRIWIETIEEHSKWHNHDHHWEETIWLIIWTIIAWILIYIWEKLIHKHQHCKSHHTWVHKDCIETSHWDCEWWCKKDFNQL